MMHSSPVVLKHKIGQYKSRGECVMERRSLKEILWIRKCVLSYPQVKIAYELHGLASFKFRTASDVKHVLRFSISDTPGFSELSEEDQECAEKLVINFLNGWGLEARDTIYPASIEWDKEYKAFKLYYSIYGEEPCYSLLFLDGSVG